MAVGDQNTLGGDQTFFPKNMCIYWKISEAQLFGTNIFMRSLFHINIFVAKFGNGKKNQFKGCFRLELKL